jgi:hypothetical protein
MDCCDLSLLPTLVYFWRGAPKTLCYTLWNESIEPKRFRWPIPGCDDRPDGKDIYQASSGSAESAAGRGDSLRLAHGITGLTLTLGLLAWSRRRTMWGTLTSRLEQAASWERAAAGRSSSEILPSRMSDSAFAARVACQWWIS